MHNINPEEDKRKAKDNGASDSEVGGSMLEVAGDTNKPRGSSETQRSLKDNIHSNI